MLLDIDEAVFADGSPHVMTVLRLIEFTMERRHTWYPAPAAAQRAADFLEINLPTKVDWREYLVNAATASAWQADESVNGVQISADNLTAMVADLAVHAVVVVENGRNDGSFLKAVFAAYNPDVHEAVERGWLHIDHAGGTGDLPYVAADAARRFREVCRVLVLKDNDQRIPRQRNAPDDQAGRGLKQPVKHIWWRHEVENYLPDAVLELSSHSNSDQLLSHLRAMTTEQQGWIDMKNGLQKSPPAYFGDLDDSCRRVWRAGYGKTLPKPLLVPADLALTVDDFRGLGDDVHAELQHLLEKILRIL